LVQSSPLGLFFFCNQPATEVAGYFQWSLRDIFGE
jgi:hypothetical protein